MLAEVALPPHPCRRRLDGQATSREWRSRQGSNLQPPA